MFVKRIYLNDHNDDDHKSDSFDFSDQIMKSKIMVWLNIIKELFCVLCCFFGLLF